MLRLKLLVVLASLGVVALSVSLYGQGGGRPPMTETPIGRYQISAAQGTGSNPVAYVVDTQTGKVWRINDTTRPFLIGDLPNR